MSTSRMALNDLQNMSSTTDNSKQKNAKMMIPKLSKRRQSVGSDVVAMESPAPCSVSVLWSELESIVQKHVADKSASSRGLNIIDTLRESMMHMKIKSTPQDLHLIGGVVHQKQERVADDTVKKEERGDCTPSYDSLIEEEPVAQDLVLNEIRLQESKEKERETELAREQALREETRIAEEKAAALQRKQEMEAEKKEKSRQKREQAKEARAKAAQAKKEKERQLKEEKEQERVQKEEQLRAAEIARANEEKEKDVMESAGFVSDDEDETGGCFIHWNANVVRPASTTPPISDELATARIGTSVTTTMTPLTTRAATSSPSHQDDNKRHHVEVSALITSEQVDAVRKSPRASALAQNSPGLGMFGNLLLNTPSSSTGQSSPTQMLSEQKEQAEDIVEHEEEEDYFGCSAGIVHMDTVDHKSSTMSIINSTNVTEQALSSTIEQRPPQPSVDSLTMLSCSDSESVVEHEMAEKQSSRAKRRSRRTSDGAVILPKPDEPGRLIGGKKKRIDTADENIRSSFSSGSNVDELPAVSSCTSLTSLATRSSSSSSLSDMPSSSSQEGQEGGQELDLPRPDECVDKRVVELVLAQDQLIDRQMDVMTTAARFQSVQNALKQAFESFVTSISSNTDERKSILLKNALLVINQPQLPTAYLTLVLALSCLQSPVVLTSSCMTQFNDLQLALLSFTCSSRSNSNSFIPASSSSSSQPMTPSVGMKRLRFQEAGVPASSCVSPPNDREPGSAGKFETYANSLADLHTTCDELIRYATSEISSDFVDVIVNLVRSLAELATNTNEVGALMLNVMKAVGNAGANACSVDISHMASILCTELSVRLYVASSNTGSQALLVSSSLYHLSIPPSSQVVEVSDQLNCRFRSVLRHRTSWVLTSIIRYYLRWLLDEPPLRTKNAPLAGDYPTISCRSTFREHYLLVAPSADSTLAARVRRVMKSSKIGVKKRRESIGASTATGGLAATSVLDIGFSCVFFQALNQIYQGLSLCFSRRHTLLQNDSKEFNSSDGVDMTTSYNRPLLSMSVMRDTAIRMPEWVTAEWAEFCSENIDNPIGHLAWQIHFSQTIVAAEQARIFIEKLLNLDLLQSIDNVSNVWNKLEYFAELLRCQGLAEDSHLALLCNKEIILEILANSFIPKANPGEGEDTAVQVSVLAGMAVDPLFMIGTLKNMSMDGGGGSYPTPARRARVSANEKVFIKESMEASTFIYDFPTCELDPNSTLSGSSSVSRRCFDHYSGEYAADEEEKD